MVGLIGDTPGQSNQLDYPRHDDGDSVNEANQKLIHKQNKFCDDRTGHVAIVVLSKHSII